MVLCKQAGSEHSKTGVEERTSFSPPPPPPSNPGVIFSDVDLH